jgi:adenylate cyclase
MRRLPRELAWGLGIGLLGILAALLPGISTVEENWELDWLFHLRGTRPAPADVVVVAIDGESARRLGLPARPSQWPREEHARLIDRLSRAGARVVCFDVTFDRPGPSPQADAQLAAAIRAAANVVLTDSLKPEPEAPGQAPGAGPLRIETLVPPIAAFEQAALAHAPFPLPRQARVDSWWTFKRSAGDRPTLPVAAFEVYAFDAYRPFLDLLAKAAPQLRLPALAAPSDLVAFGGAGSLNDALRGIFQADPQVGRRMLEELDRSGDRDIPSAMKRRIRSLVHLYSGDESAWLNFRGPPRTITTVPYDLALQGGEGAAGVRPDVDFAGKAVFVGFSASTLSEQDRTRDDYQTVFSQADGLYLSGVEIAATAFADLLEDSPVRPLPAPWRIGILLLWGVALGVGCRLLRPGVAAALVIVMVPAYLLLAVHQFSAASLWLPLVVPLCLQAPMSLARGLYLNYRDARKDRERFREILGHYLPSHVVDQLLVKVTTAASTDRLVHGTCLATDVERYMSIAEQMPPAELVRLMNAYFAELFKPVERLGGFVTNLSGDAMLAIWPGTASDRSAGRQACLAALDIAEALKRFNQGAGDRPALQTRLGLHSGHMLLGALGASRHFQYEAMGDMVNTATRIQGLGKYLGVQILASEAAVDGLQDVLTRPLGSFLLVGKTAPVAVVELMGLMANVHPQCMQLCAKFAEGLDAYRTRQWTAAVSFFSELLSQHPQDGPSRFYLSRCQDFMLNPPVDPWDATVRIEQK